MPRARHPKPEVEAALAYAESRGCQIEKISGRGHAWGKVRCRDCPLIWVWSTPQSPGNHGKDLRHKVDKCLEP
jgi:hypothetical protein